MKNGAYSRQLDHGGECLVEVESQALREVADNPSGLAALETAIFMKFIFEDPFTGDHMSATGSWYKLPGAIDLKGAVLVVHGLKPCRITQCSTHRGGHIISRGEVGVVRV